MNLTRNMATPARTLTALLATVVFVTGLTLSPTPAAAAYPSFTFTGAGYGHGIGLSQYGAKGFAEKGRTGEWIASYYYPGSKIEKRAGAVATRDVHIDKNKAARAQWQIRPGYSSGASLLIWVGGVQRATLGVTDAPYTVSASGTSVRITNKNGTVLGDWAGTVEIRPSGGTPALTQVVGASGPFDHAYVRYRGRLLFSVAGANVKCINRVSMQEYLYGVVPRESPASWHVEALKAQAIVARSYSAQKTGELACTTSDQVYNGHSKTNSLWQQASADVHEGTNSNKAVDETNDLYVVYGGNIVQTFFHSSSGGHTANIEDVWPGTGQPSTTNPHRKGVPDPYCAGPYDPWTGDSIKSYDGMTLAKALTGKGIIVPTGAGTSVWVKSLALDRAWPSGFVRKLDISWSDGSKTAGVSGDAMRSALGLRSTKFFVNGIYTRVAAATRYQTAVEVSQKAYPTAGAARAAIIVNGADDRYPDSLTGSALGGVAQGPVLLVRQDSVPQEVAGELRRLGVTKAYVIGGEAAVSPEVFATIKGIVADTRRLAGGGAYGTDRYGTAASVAMEIKALGGDASHVLIASGENWPDAAVAASVGAGAKRPLLLVRKNSLPAGTVRALADLGATRTAVFGGPAVISDETLKGVLARTGEAAPEKRFGATGTRYDTAAGAADWCTSAFGYSLSTVYIASGETFIDSVTGGVLAGMNHFPLLLTNRASASTATSAYLDKNRAAIANVVIIGGPVAVTDLTASLLASYAY